jgi:NRPS condensation-like uncharacterized protein
MNTKLTLTLEQDIIKKAKEYAKSKGYSLSDIVENYLKVVVSQQVNLEPKISPITESMRGSFKNDSDLDYKEQLAELLSKKYL